MNYELAKELKEAGFREDIYLYEKTKEIGNPPTLEELIDECGIMFRWLKKHPTRKLMWEAQSKGLKERDTNGVWQMNPDIHAWGETPTEAVAKLWIELHK
jgi:hypothetical protein